MGVTGVYFGSGSMGMGIEALQQRSDHPLILSYGLGDRGRHL